MIRLRAISIRWIISGAILITALVLLGIGFWVTARHAVESFRRDLIETLVQVASAVGDYSVADLAFGTHEESAKNLARLRESAHIEAVALYDATGDLFSDFVRSDAQRRGVRDRLVGDIREEVVVEPGFVEVYRPLVRQGERFGTIYLRASTAELDRRIAAYLLWLAGVGAGLVLLSVVFALVFQRVVSTPILRLSRAAQVVSSTEDWSTRLTERGAREVVHLTRSFNNVLRVVEQRQAERDEAERSQRRYAERLRVLREIDRAILEPESLPVIARRALEGLATLVPSVVSAVADCTDDHRGSSLLAALPPWADGPGIGVVEAVRDGEALASAFASGRPVEMDIAGDTTGLPPSVRAVAAAGARMTVSFPLRAEDLLLGCLTVGVHRREDLSPEDNDTVQEVAALVALAVRQHRMAREIERHTAELERRVSERTSQLEASNRELEAFAYSVAHDLRAPLRSIHTFASALQEDYPDALDDAGKDLLRRVVEASRRMDALIRDLLEYSRVAVKEVELASVDLDRVVEEARGQLASVIADRGAEVAVEAPLGRVVGHHATLLQVVVNLLSNAVKFVAAGTTPRVRVRAEARDGGVRLWIEDNGIGIEPQYHERIFRLFERLHGADAYPGTGVGLAIVKRGMEHMGGRTGLESEAGQGTRFWIELPAAPC